MFLLKAEAIEFEDDRESNKGVSTLDSMLYEELENCIAKNEFIVSGIIR